MGGRFLLASAGSGKDTMIRLTFSAAIGLYVFLSVLGLLGIWLGFERSRTVRRVSFAERHLWHCEVCVTPYVDSRSDRISRCPNCGSLNARNQGGES